MKKISIGKVVGSLSLATGAAAHILSKRAKELSYSAEPMEPIKGRDKSVYERFIKRGLDVACATGAIVCFSPVYIGVAVLVKLKLGSPVLYTQDRPGIIGSDGRETIFKMYKFRTMTDERDENGNLLPDEIRLTKFGAWLRSTSLDELPEAFNILNGTMSVIGPRPQLVRDMTFMTKEQRARHTAKPGLSGLAQVNGRNNIDWKDKIDWDIKYINNVNICNDIAIVFRTVEKAIIKREGITEGEMATAEDYGDYLLNHNEINQKEYDIKQDLAKKILRRESIKNELSGDINDFRFSVSMCVYGGDDPQCFDLALNSIVTQTTAPTEVVIVVDGPIPNGIQIIIDSYQQRMDNAGIDFRVIYLKENVGHGEARRICLNNCSYSLVAIMDADDISVPDRFEEQINYFRSNPNTSIVGGFIEEFINQDNPGDTSTIAGQRVVPLTDKEIKEYMKKRCPMNQVTVMFRKKDVLEVGGYIDWYCEEDYYLWLRLAQAGKVFGNIEKVLVQVRVGTEMYRRRGGLRYFNSEARLQKYMMRKGVIGVPRYCINVGERLILQVLMPNSARELVFKRLARK